MTSPSTDRRLGLLGSTGFKAPVTVLAAANVTQYGQQTIDGKALLAVNADGVADRVLCVGQTDATQNGIWDVSTAAWTRSLDSNQNYDLKKGTTVIITDGTTYAGTYWQITAANPITLGTTSITWARALASSLTTLSFLQAGTGAVTRGAQDKMREIFSIADFGGVPDDATKKATNLTAFQTAMKALKAAGGGKLLIPPGTWHLSCASPIFVPSNVTIEGVRGASTVKPDVADLPTVSGDAGVFVTGNPNTNTRAGTTSSVVASCVGAVDPTTIVSNVHIRGVKITCDFAGTLGSTQTLRGIFWAFAYDSSVCDCDCYNIPNGGILTLGGARHLVMGNVMRECGWTAYAGTARNGISLSGWMDQITASQSSQSVVCIGNVSNDNYDEGIQFACIKGVVIADNILIGNRDRGIEGDSGYELPTITSATYGQEVPGDAIIHHNYIDGAGTHQSTSSWGITVGDVNQKRLEITDNYVRNVASSGGAFGGGIEVKQNNNAVAVVRGNTLEGISPAANYHAIFVQSGRVFVEDNHVLSFTGGSNQTGIVVRYLNNAVVQNNVIESGVDRAVYVFCGWSAGVYTPTLLRIKGNSCVGTRNDGIHIDFPYQTTLTSLDVSDNVISGINSTGTNDKAGVTIDGTGAASVTITSAYISGNKFTYAGATLYPIRSNNIAVGSIGTMEVQGNSFGSPTMPTGKRVVETESIATLLFQSNNSVPGYRMTFGAAAPVAGTWAVGDKVVLIAPAAGGTEGYVCTADGTPGTWKAFGTIAA